jgi:hypothetical protein
MRRGRSLRFVMLLACAGALSGTTSLTGCGGSGSGGGSYLFGTARFGTSDLLNWDANNFDGRGLGGDGVFALDAGGEVVVGWEHYDDVTLYYFLISHVYRGALLFNIGLLNEGAPKTITKATLSFRILTGCHEPSSGFFESSPLMLMLGTTDWHGFPEVTPPTTFPAVAYPYPPWDTTPVPSVLLGGTVEIDVTPVVKDWKDGVRPNRGFILRDVTEDASLYFDNNCWWEILASPTLRVEFK